MSWGRTRANKFNARKVTWEGQVFDSGLELTRWLGLREDLRLGRISELRRQVRYDFVLNGINLGWYVADFVYLNAAGELVVEDAKGCRPKGWGLKKKHMLAFHGIRVIEWPPEDARPVRARKRKRHCPDCGVAEGFEHLCWCTTQGGGVGECHL